MRRCLSPFSPRFSCLLLVAILGLRPLPAGAHGDVHTRIEALTGQIASVGPSPARYLARAGLYRLHGEFAHALADLDRAAALDPGLPRLDCLRGSLLLDAGTPRQALAPLDRFLAAHPDDGEGLLVRARVHAALGNGPAAAADYDRAIARLAPPSPDVFLERAECLLATGAHPPEIVLQGLDQGMRILGPIPSLQDRAIALECTQGHYARALTRLKSLIARSPANPELLCRKAELLDRAGDDAAANQAYHDALALLESLPPSRRGSAAVRALEQRIRTGLERPAG